MYGFSSKDPASGWGKRVASADKGSSVPNGYLRRRGKTSRGGSFGRETLNDRVAVEVVLFEEPSRYGPAFILPLVKIIKALAPGSPEGIKGIHAVCKSILRSHIGADGSLSLHGGGGGFFVFRFGDIGDAEATRQARIATDEIGHKLLGDLFFRTDITENSTFSAAQATESDLHDETVEQPLSGATEENGNGWAPFPNTNGDMSPEKPDCAGARRDAYRLARGGLSAQEPSAKNKKAHKNGS